MCHQRTGPKGREELDVREWTCSHCGAQHKRDVNAAINIRERGLAWLETQFSIASEKATGPSDGMNKALGLNAPGPRPDVVAS